MDDWEDAFIDDMEVIQIDDWRKSRKEYLSIVEKKSLRRLGRSLCSRLIDD